MQVELAQARDDAGQDVARLEALGCAVLFDQGQHELAAWGL